MKTDGGFDVAVELLELQWGIGDGEEGNGKHQQDGNSDRFHVISPLPFLGR